MHAYLGSFSRFIADDYCSAAVEHRLGIFRAAWYWYITWTGRYSANFADALFGALGPNFTPAVTSFVILIWLASLGLAIFLLLPSRNKRTRWLMVGTLAPSILFLTFALTTNVRQSLYWSQGMRSVIPPLVMGTLFVCLFVWSYSRVLIKNRVLVWSVLGLLLSYIAGGFSETYTVFQLSAFLIAIVIWFFIDKHILHQESIFILVAGLLGSILALITVLFAPGNPYRQAYFPPSPSLLVILDISIKSFGAYWLRMFSSIQLLLAMLSAVAVGIYAGIFLDFKTTKRRSTVLILVFGMGLVFTCFPPSAYGLSDSPPDRTLIIPTYGLVLTLVALGISLRTFFGRSRPIRHAVLMITAFLLVLSSGLSLHQMIISRETFIKYADAWSVFNNQMISSRASKLTRVLISTDEMNGNNWSRLDVLGDNPKFWLNRCVSDYYGLEVTSNSPPP